MYRVSQNTICQLYKSHKVQQKLVNYDLYKNLNRLIFPKKDLEENRSLNYESQNCAQYLYLVKMNFNPDESDKKAGIFVLKLYFLTLTSDIVVRFMRNKTRGKTIQKATYSLRSKKI